MIAERYYVVVPYRSYYLARLSDSSPAGPYAVISLIENKIVRAGISLDEARAIVRAWGVENMAGWSLNFEESERWAARVSTLSRPPNAAASEL